METATVLIAKRMDEKGLPFDFDYCKVELPDNFYRLETSLKSVRKELENIYKGISGSSYVMVKFDKIEKFFDQ